MQTRIACTSATRLANWKRTEEKPLATLDLNSPIASRISDLLVAREEKVGIAESSTGGLISATLLASG